MASDGPRYNITQLNNVIGLAFELTDFSQYQIFKLTADDTLLQRFKDEILPLLSDWLLPQDSFAQLSHKPSRGSKAPALTDPTLPSAQPVTRSSVSDPSVALQTSVDAPGFQVLASVSAPSTPTVKDKASKSPRLLKAHRNNSANDSEIRVMNPLYGDLSPALRRMYPEIAQGKLIEAKLLPLLKDFHSEALNIFWPVLLKHVFQHCDLFQEATLLATKPKKLKAIKKLLQDNIILLARDLEFDDSGNNALPFSDTNQSLCLQAFEEVLLGLYQLDCKSIVSAVHNMLYIAKYTATQETSGMTHAQISALYGNIFIHAFGLFNQIYTQENGFSGDACRRMGRQYVLMAAILPHVLSSNLFNAAYSDAVYEHLGLESKSASLTKRFAQMLSISKSQSSSSSSSSIISHASSFDTDNIANVTQTMIFATVQPLPRARLFSATTLSSSSMLSSSAQLYAATSVSLPLSPGRTGMRRNSDTTELEKSKVRVSARATLFDANRDVIDHDDTVVFPLPMFTLDMHRVRAQQQQDHADDEQSFEQPPLPPRPSDKKPPL